MAGGVGSRLWPLSREKRPKQFINADGEKCMLLQTLERINPVVPPNNCFVITNQDLKDITLETLEGRIPPANIITEPLRRNTAACIAYAVFALKHKGKEGTVCFFPADGYVRDALAYRTAVELAYGAAGASDSLVIIGIPPTYPATGYGYLSVDTEEESGVYRVGEFREKPDLSTAEKLLSLGNYWWNSGIVAGRLDAFTAHIGAFLPDHEKAFSAVPNDSDRQDFILSLQQAYAGLPEISFDKGVLEKSKDILAVKGNFDWDDIGSLSSLAAAASPDANGNHMMGKFVGIDTRGSVIYAERPLVAAIGVENMVIAVTDDAVFICPKERTQEVRQLVDKLKENGYESYT